MVDVDAAHERLHLASRGLLDGRAGRLVLEQHADVAQALPLTHVEHAALENVSVSASRQTTVTGPAK